jgi:hypothetical protein
VLSAKVVLSDGGFSSIHDDKAVRLQPFRSTQGGVMKQRNVARRTARKDRLIREEVHDPYKSRLKLAEPSVCSQCGAVFQKGRWAWTACPADAQDVLCQACRRINDGYPAGEVTLSGGFLQQHRQEILNLARKQGEQEKAERPLHRIMAVEQEQGGVLIQTTDIHLPRRIGEAVHSAYEGDLDYRYNEDTYFIRVAWRRDG